MSSKEFEVNGTDYKVVLTDQVIGQVNSLKDLYNTAYEDPESFEDVSAEISNTINEIASNVEPPAEDSDLDGLIQEIIKAVDTKASEIEKELQEKVKPKKKTKSKK
jgi:protein subunit release factor A